MSSFIRANNRFIRAALLTGFFALLTLFVVRSSQTSVAQETKKPETGGDQVARGKYIVEDVAMCQTCHTPRGPNGRLNRSQWLQGGPVPYLPAEPTANWPQIVPRIGGRIPATKDQMVTLLTTGIWIDGNELRDPMPKFHMNKADAEAVVAYLQTTGR
jgi:mono/diheme cytochrome c family protein